MAIDSGDVKVLKENMPATGWRIFNIGAKSTNPVSGINVSEPTGVLDPEEVDRQNSYFGSRMRELIRVIRNW